MSRIFLEKGAKKPPWLNARAKGFPLSCNRQHKLLLYSQNLLLQNIEYKGGYAMIDFENGSVFKLRRNVQGVTGKKKDFTILPYSKIQLFSIETSGVLDIDSELELYFSSVRKIIFEFTGGSDIVRIGQAISEYIL